MDWFLYDNGLRHERVKLDFKVRINLYYFTKFSLLCVLYLQKFKKHDVFDLTYLGSMHLRVLDCSKVRLKH